MKKVLTITTAFLLIAGVAFASDKCKRKKKCAKSKTECAATKCATKKSCCASKAR